jgi:hypothetical protein
MSLFESSSLSKKENTVLAVGFFEIGKAGKNHTVFVVVVCNF